MAQQYYIKTHLPDRVRFTPLHANRKIYASMAYHRAPNFGPHGEPKAVWLVSDDEESLVFHRSDINNWICHNGYLWGVGNNADGRIELGTRKERLACFAAPSPGSTDWHGYPIKSTKGQPPKQVVSDWVEKGVITRAFKTKIVKELV